MARDRRYSCERLSGLFPIFYEAVARGVRDGLELYPATAHVHRVTTRRSITRDHIVDRLRAALDGNPAVRIRDDNQTTYFDVHNEFSILIKMCDENGNVALNRTQLALEFQDQMSLSRELFPEVTNLYLGYVPNPLDPAHPAVLLVCPDGDEAYWIHELSGGEAGEAPAEITPAPTPPSGDEEELVRIPKRPEAGSERPDE